jgi:glycosyltransferase involved in cell wall biosynthesis
VSEPSASPRGAAEPVASVVVAARDEGEALPRLLAALRTQSAAAGSFELIVVDDGSRDATASVAASEAFGRVVRLGSAAGRSAARNRGVAESRGELIAFTDADCEPAADWIERGIAALGAGPAGIVAGEVHIALGDRPSRAALVDAASHLDQEHYAATGFGVTANLWMGRALFERLGGFNPMLEHGEEEEFCHRAVAAGEQVAYSGEVVVRHPPRSGYGALARKGLHAGVGAARLRRYGAPALVDFERFWTQPRAWLPPRRLRGKERLEARGIHPRGSAVAGLLATHYLCVQLPRALGDLVESLRGAAAEATARGRQAARHRRRRPLPR